MASSIMEAVGTSQVDSLAAVTKVACTSEVASKSAVNTQLAASDHSIREEASATFVAFITSKEEASQGEASQEVAVGNTMAVILATRMYQFFLAYLLEIPSFYLQKSLHPDDSCPFSPLLHRNCQEHSSPSFFVPY